MSATPTCEDCGRTVAALHTASQDIYDSDLCPSCFDNRQEVAWERQQEALASLPSLDEQWRAAWALKQELRR